MRKILLSISILVFSCSKNEKHTDYYEKDTVIVPSKNQFVGNYRKQYKDINSRNDSLLTYAIKFLDEKELNELLNKETLIKGDPDSLEVYEYNLRNYIENKFLEIDWSMPSGQLMIGKNLFKIIKIDGESKLLRLEQGGFSNRGLSIDSISIFKFIENKLELDTLTNQLPKYRDISFFTKDTTKYSQLKCFDLVYELIPSDDFIHINLQERPNACAPGEYLDLQKNNIKAAISIRISKGKLMIVE